MNVPDDLRYSTDHEWARLEGRHASASASPTTPRTRSATSSSSQLPEVGATVGGGRVDRARSSPPSRCPTSTPRSPGTVVEVNTDLADAPERLNEDPYGEGWICVIEPDDPAQLDALLDADGYRALIEG